MLNNIDEIKEKIKDCNKCKLCKTRTNIVLGSGNANAKIMLIGEGPGADEDREGLPFVGKAGKLMNFALEGIGIDRNNLYITNIVKCRPPKNRDPEADEIEACIEYVKNQIQVIKPKIIVLLGKIALQNILGPEYKITSSRGKWIEKDGIFYLPTWHPAALLRDENKKIQFWEDFELVRNKADELNLKY